MGRDRDDDFDELFGDDDDFGGFDDDGDDDAYDFGDDDELAEGDLDEDQLAGFGDDDDDLFGDESTPRRGPSRAFLIIAGVMILFFLCGIGLIVLLILNPPAPPGPSPFQQTATSIVQTNVAVEEALAQTETQNAINRDLTATATLFTPTPTATETPMPTDTPTPTEPPSPTPDEPVDTPEPVDETPTPEEIGISAVQQTATALVDLFRTPTVLETPTPAVGGVVTQPQPPTPGLLPDTGLFDDIVSPGGVGMIFLAAIGLVGVIFVSRRTRSKLNE